MKKTAAPAAVERKQRGAAQGLAARDQPDGLAAPHLCRKDGKQTTVSIDDIFIEMMALNLGHQPDSDESRRAVRQWMQERIDKSSGRATPSISANG